MSAPATKARSPAPVTITTRTLASDASSVIARSRSSSIARLSAFNACGRLNVTIATAGFALSRSTPIVSSMGKRKHQPADHDGDQHEADKHQPAEPELLASIVLGDDGEDERDEEGEQRHQDQMTVHASRL